MTRWLRRLMALGLILHGLAHAGVGMWFTHHALAYGHGTRLLVGTILWTWVTVRFVRAGFALPHHVRVASRLAAGAAILSLGLIAIGWSPALWFGVLVDAVVLLTVGFAWPARLLVRKAPRHRALTVRNAILVGIGASTLLWPLYAHWGSRPEELRAVMPGDEAMSVKPYDVVYQNAVTIHAPPERVWSWLVQVGQGRGGFYSYEWMENVFGLRIHNAERVDPELQTLHAGDRVRVAPDGWLGTHDLGWTVFEIQEGSVIVLRYWGSFVVLPDGDHSTRLLARSPLGDPRDHPGFAAAGLVWEPVHFLMQRKMLLGIKERAERGGPAPPVNSGGERQAVAAPHEPHE